MASDDPADDPRDGDPGETPPRDPSSGRFRRRPPPTLDLPATDVTPRETVATTDSAAEREEAGAAEAAAEAASVAESTDSTTSAAASDANDPPPAAMPPTAPPRRQMGLPAIIFAALFSGLVGGAVAFMVASSFFDAAENIDAITDIEARVMDLRQRMDAIENRQPAGSDPRVGALADQITALETKLAAVQGAPASPPPELMERIAAAEALARQANTDASRPAASPDALAALGSRVAGLEQGIDGLAKAGEMTAKGAAQLAALAALRSALSTAAPIDVELGAARALLGPAGVALEPLQKFAASGLPNGPQLAQRLREAFAVSDTPASASTAAEPDAVAAEEPGLLARLKRSAEGLVSVRKVEDGAPTDSGETVPADLAKAEAALMRDDMVAALAALKTLPAADAAKAGPIVADIEARQAALASIATLNRQVLAALSGRTP